MFAQLKPFKLGQSSRKTKVVREPKSYMDMVIPSQAVVFINIKRKEDKKMSRRKEKLYHIYHGIKQRCYNPNNPKYNIYGGKGIKMCQEWLNDYEIFRAWAIENGYKDNARLSIDRKDSNKDYCPNNCQWITLSQNSAKANIGLQKNKSKGNRMIGVSPDGVIVEIVNVSKFCRENHLDRRLVSHRLNGIISNPYLDGWKFYREE